MKSYSTPTNLLSFIRRDKIKSERKHLSSKLVLILKKRKNKWLEIRKKEIELNYLKIMILKVISI